MPVTVTIALNWNPSALRPSHGHLTNMIAARAMTHDQWHPSPGPARPGNKSRDNSLAGPIRRRPGTRSPTQYRARSRPGESDGHWTERSPARRRRGPGLTRVRPPGRGLEVLKTVTRTVTLTGKPIMMFAGAGCKKLPWSDVTLAVELRLES